MSKERFLMADLLGPVVRSLNSGYKSRILNEFVYSS